MINGTSCAWSRTGVKLLQRQRLGLWNKQERHEEPHDIPRCVPPKRSLRRERTNKRRKREGDDEVAISYAIISENRRGKRGTTYKNHSQAVDSDIPKSRTAIGYASAEYYRVSSVSTTWRPSNEASPTVNGTGPAPGEYDSVNR